MSQYRPVLLFYCELFVSATCKNLFVSATRKNLFVSATRRITERVTHERTATVSSAYSGQSFDGLPIGYTLQDDQTGAPTNMIGKTQNDKASENCFTSANTLNVSCSVHCISCMKAVHKGAYAKNLKISQDIPTKGTEWLYDFLLKMNFQYCCQSCCQCNGIKLATHSILQMMQVYLIYKYTYTYTYIYIYIYMYIHIHIIHTHTHTHIYVCMYVCIYVYLYICVNTHSHTHKYIYMYTYICVCVYRQVCVCVRACVLVCVYKHVSTVLGR